MCEDFYPMAPEIYYRYYKEDYVEPVRTKCELPPMTTEFQTHRLPHGWKEFLHPEGARYFLYESMSLYTDADVYNLSVLRHATRLINEFNHYTRTRNIVLKTSMNVVFDMFYDSEDDTCLCRYYIVDHNTRSVFWLDKFDVDQLQAWEAVKGVTEYHCLLFPDAFRMGEVEVEELKDILTYWIGDRLTSRTSTTPYTVEQLQTMLFLTNNLSKNLRSKGGASAYARLMHIFARQRFLDFHGQPTVRLDRDRSIHRPANLVPSRPWLFRCLSPLMFSAPDTYYRRITEVYLDGLIRDNEWKSLVSHMNNEWGDSILTGTVILTANVAFLAIQCVDGATIPPNRSPAQILSFVSVVASIGCIVIGLLLVRKNKSTDYYSMGRYLNSFKKEKSGVEALALVYSIPYMLLMWSVILFLAAFSFYSFNSSRLYVRLIVTGSWIVVSFLSLWCILTMARWDGGDFSVKGISAWREITAAIKRIAVETFQHSFKLQPEQGTLV